jgi:hypothetical protein
LQGPTEAQIESAKYGLTASLRAVKREERGEYNR